MSLGPIPKHREFSAYFMVQGYGISFQWGVVDVIQEGFLYGVHVYRHHDPWRWVQFRWNKHKDDPTQLEYSEGKRGRQIVHWRLRGPLVHLMEPKSD